MELLLLRPQNGTSVLSAVFYFIFFRSKFCQQCLKSSFRADSISGESCRGRACSSWQMVAAANNSYLAGFYSLHRCMTIQERKPFWSFFFRVRFLNYVPLNPLLPITGEQNPFLSLGSGFPLLKSYVSCEDVATLSPGIYSYLGIVKQ